MHTNRYDNWVKSKLVAESKAIANQLNHIDTIKEIAIKSIESGADLDTVLDEALWLAYGQAITDMATEIGTVTNKLIERTTE